MKGNKVPVSLQDQNKSPAVQGQVGKYVGGFHQTLGDSAGENLWLNSKGYSYERVKT